jgi:acyl-CoA synthetase (NDP forming)
MLPSFWSKGNPVDLVGQPDINIFRKSIEVMASSDAFDAIVFLGVIGSFKMGLRCTTAAQRMIDPSRKDSPEMRGIVEDMQRQFLDNIIGLIEKYDKPIYPVALVHFKEDDIIHIKEGSRYKVIVYKTPEEAVLCLERQYRYAQYLKNQER